MTKENELMVILEEKALRKLGKDFEKFIRNIPTRYNLNNYKWADTVFEKYRSRLESLIAEYRDEMKRLGFPEDPSRMPDKDIGAIIAKLYPENLEIAKGSVFSDLEDVILRVLNRTD
jgi:hypothetical protein